MNRRAKEFLFWAPRMLCIVFAGFLAVFALDVFNERNGVVGTIFAFVVHLVPAAVMLAALAIFWRREGIAAAIFGVLGVYYALANLNHPSWALVISGPLLLISALFLIDWWKRNELRPAP